MKGKILATMIAASICVEVILILMISIGAANGIEEATIKVTEIPIGKNYTETYEVWLSSDFPSSGSYKFLADIKSDKAKKSSNYPNPFNTPASLVKSVKKLTPYTSDEWDESPSFSPDMTKIVFESCTTMGRVDPVFDDNVWIMDIDGKKKTRLSKSKFFDGSPAFSSDGTKIIFSSAPKKLSAEVEKNIWTMNIDGSDQKQITVEEIQECPLWSPNGTMKVFEKWIEGKSWHESGERRTETGYEWWESSGYISPTDLTKTIAYTRNACTHPSWSPDGNKILFENFYAIWMMNSDGGNLTLLSPEGTVDSYPSWSPDGSKVVFISSKSKNNDTWITDIWRMNSDGSNRKQLTDDDVIEWEPSYSPDGKKIVFISLQSGIPSIWIMDSNGTNKQQLTSGYPAEQPKWSSDGSNIVFASDGDIWMMSLNVTPIVTPSAELTPLVPPTPTPITPTPTTSAPTLTPTSSPVLIPSPTATEIPAPEESVPGFEVIFAIVGLLVVAYLLRRRK